MLDPIRKLLTEAGKAKQTRAFWQSATEILGEWAGGARVQLTYKGLSESGTLEAGPSGKDGETFLTDYHDAEGRHVSARFEGLPTGFPGDVLRSGVEIATHLAVMVARRSALERERRLGTFLVELSRWLLAAPERELLLRYTLQSVTSLVDAQGAYVTLRGADPETLRVASTVGQCVELEGAEIAIDASATGRVIRTGEPFLTDNILTDAGAQPALSPSGMARPRDGSPWHGRVLVTQPSGDRRICDCTITGLSGVGPDGLLVALYDRTDELRAQRELIAREKLATVGEIASGVAHEVNNPLAAIRMEAELLKRGTRDADTEAAASTIVREVDRAARIVRSLLRLARRADTDPTRVQLHDLVRDVAEIRERVL